MGKKNQTQPKTKNPNSHSDQLQQANKYLNEKQQLEIVISRTYCRQKQRSQKCNRLSMEVTRKYVLQKSAHGMGLFFSLQRTKLLKYFYSSFALSLKDVLTTSSPSFPRLQHCDAAVDAAVKEIKVSSMFFSTSLCTQIL